MTVCTATHQERMEKDHVMVGCDMGVMYRKHQQQGPEKATNHAQVSDQVMQEPRLQSQGCSMVALSSMTVFGARHCMCRLTLADRKKNRAFVF